MPAAATKPKPTQSTARRPVLLDLPYARKLRRQRRHVEIIRAVVGVEDVGVLRAQGFEAACDLRAGAVAEGDQGQVAHAASHSASTSGSCSSGA